MATTLDGKKAFWRYDPVAHDTYCDIIDPEGNTITSVKSNIMQSNTYSRVKAKLETFRIAMNKIAEEDLLDRNTRVKMWRDFSTKVLKEKAK